MTHKQTKRSITKKKSKKKTKKIMESQRKKREKRKRERSKNLEADFYSHERSSSNRCRAKRKEKLVA